MKKKHKIIIGDSRYMTEIPDKTIIFLNEKTKGKKVFMKFDTIKYDEDNNLFCYLYLQNKTFLNANLIKKGLSDVDTTIDFKYKSKFLEESTLK